MQKIFFLLLKKLRNTESAQLCIMEGELAGRVSQRVRVSYGRWQCGGIPGPPL